MKKHLILLLLVASTLDIHAQSIEIGVRAGINYHFNTSFGYDRQRIQNPLPASELYATIKVGKRIRLLTSFQYSGKSKTNFLDTVNIGAIAPYPIRGTYTTDFYEGSIGLSYRIKEIRKWSINAITTFSWYRKNIYKEYLNDGTSQATGSKRDIDHDFRVVYYGSVGIIGEYKISPALILSVKGTIAYNTGLTHWLDFPTEFDNDKIRINIMAGLGYRF
ncbi:MAG: hypothetical protein H0X33_03475 [Taibaiella sp.]|nr:hypothetical protein [Taibaiella sp.]